MRTTFYLTLTFFLLFTPATFAQKARAINAVQNGWEVLGNKRVSKRVERDVLKVGRNEGGFTKLKIRVTGGTVYMGSMVVTYGNGQKDIVSLKHTFRAGAESRVIDLNGGTRMIKKITFVYDRKNNSRGAKVWVGARS